MLVVIQKDKAFGRQNLRKVLHVYHHNSALLVYHAEDVGIRHKVERLYLPSFSID